jgi:hypothetical protein
MRAKFYTAGKIWHAPKFQELRDTHNMPVQARWIDVDNESDLVQNRKGDLWQMCYEDVRDSKFVLLYSEQESEEQRGALVELGMAYGMNKPVFAIGTCKTLQPNGISDVAFTHYKLFHRLNTTDLLYGANLALAYYAKMYSPAARIALSTGKV